MVVAITLAPRTEGLEGRVVVRPGLLVAVQVVQAEVEAAHNPLVALEGQAVPIPAQPGLPRQVEQARTVETVKAVMEVPTMAALPMEEMAETEINAFLSLLAVKEHVSASTQNQALSALLFLYRHVIGREVGSLGGVIRARKPKRLPVVMTREEVKAVLNQLSGDKLGAKLGADISTGWCYASKTYGVGNYGTPGAANDVCK